MSIFAGVHLGGRLGTDEEAGCPGPELVDVVHGGHVSSAPAAAHLCPHNLCSQCCQGDSGPLSLSVHTASPAQPSPANAIIQRLSFIFMQPTAPSHITNVHLYN